MGHKLCVTTRLKHWQLVHNPKGSPIPCWSNCGGSMQRWKMKTVWILSYHMGYPRELSLELVVNFAWARNKICCVKPLGYGVTTSVLPSISKTTALSMSHLCSYGAAGHTLWSRNIYLIQPHYSRLTKVNLKISVVLLGKTCSLSAVAKLIGYNLRFTMWEETIWELNQQRGKQNQEKRILNIFLSIQIPELFSHINKFQSELGFCLLK